MLKQVKILFVNECGSDNLGDLAISLGISRYFGQRHDQFNVSFFHLEKGQYLDVLKEGGKVVDQMPAYGIKKKITSGRLGRLLSLLYLCYWAPRYVYRCIKYRRVFKEVDVVVFGGGSLIMNNKYHFPIAIFICTCFSLFYKKRIGYVGVSIGNKLDRLSSRIFNWCVRHSSFTYVRDVRSLAFFSSNLGCEGARIGPDFALINQYGEGAQLSVDTKKAIGFNVSINSAGIRESLYDQIVSCFGEWAAVCAGKRNVIVYSTGCVEDDAVVNKFCKSLNGAGVPYERVIPQNLEELSNLISRLDVSFNMRLHASILGISQGVGVVGLPSSPKVAGFFTANGIDENYIDIDMLNSLGTDADTCLIKSKVEWYANNKAVMKDVVTIQMQMMDNVVHDLDTLL